MAATGTASLDFGVFPGTSHTSLTVTGQVGITAGSLVEAWIFPAATADHTADEHVVESIKVMAGNVVAGTGFTIYGVNTSEINEPVVTPVHPTSVFTASATTIGVKSAQPGANAGGGKGTLIYGVFNIAWVYN
jgi:hypothetical protein